MSAPWKEDPQARAEALALVDDASDYDPGEFHGIDICALFCALNHSRIVPGFDSSSPDYGPRFKEIARYPLWEIGSGVESAFPGEQYHFSVDS